MGWLGTWKYRVQIEVWKNIVPIYNIFPVVIRIGDGDTSNPDIFTELGNNAKKIAVTNSDGLTQHNVEIEKWDVTNKIIILWITVPSLKPSDLFYVYYDARKADNALVGFTGEAAAKAVWNYPFFKAVYLMNSDIAAGTLFDSTPNNNNGDLTNFVTGNKVDGAYGTSAYSFTGTNRVDGLGVGSNFPSGNSDLVIMFMFKHGAADPAKWAGIFQYGKQGSNTNRRLEYMPDGRIRFGVQDVGDSVSTITIVDNQWKSILCSIYTMSSQLWVKAAINPASSNPNANSISATIDTQLVDNWTIGAYPYGVDYNGSIGAFFILDPSVITNSYFYLINWQQVFYDLITGNNIWCNGTEQIPYTTISILSNKFKYSQLSNLINLTTDTIKIILMNTSFEFDAILHKTLADVTAWQLPSQYGYVQNSKIVTNPAAIQDDANNKSKITWDEVSWLISGGNIITGSVVFYDDDTADKIVLGSIKFVDDQSTTDGSHFKVRGITIEGY